MNTKKIKAIKGSLKKSAYCLGFCAYVISLLGGAVCARAQSVDEGGAVTAPSDMEAYYTVTTFTITAYYSPLSGQEHYLTGSYEGDIYLNGNGTNGADGTQVYPGMVAAPKSYPFGTKMYIPGVGLVAVHDRGGAIKHAGERGNEYDRLDIWMGSGDSGLNRALTWGKRVVDVRVYGINESLTEEVYLEAYTGAENFLTSTILSPLEFPEDIYFGDSGESVTKMQEYLVTWGYLSEASGFYSSDTAQAIFAFQIDFGIVSGPDEMGAGHFGINTRKKFDTLINDENAKDTVKIQKGSLLLKRYPDLFEEEVLFASALELGDSGETVRALQEELQRLGYLRIEATGNFGETTEHALFKFQQSIGLVNTKDDSGAGYLGPGTRTALNRIIENRFSTKSIMAYRRDEISSGKHIVRLPDSILASLKEEE
ncbi:MAG: peptidoglycan-binding protein [Candidatus Gracilibacteria bacterium]|jgi:peptidoglycan hydrolase-like protein with peptidoglycan-binding domain/3D (Asp-Asp-Asp) domain-containing protein